MKPQQFFELENNEYIELNRLLKTLQLVQSGGEAKMAILNHEVTLNGETEIRIRKKLRKGDIIEFDENRIEVQ